MTFFICCWRSSHTHLLSPTLLLLLCHRVLLLCVRWSVFAQVGGGAATAAACDLMSGFEGGEVRSLKVLIPDLDPKLEQVLSAVAQASRRISKALNTGCAHTKSGVENSFGDEQLHLDVVTDEIAFEELRASRVVSIASSEETPEERDLGGDGFSVSFDPLDGSSILDTNFAVGSIFGIWPGKGLLGRTGREQVAAAIAVYGPRTTMVVALAGSTPRAVQMTLQASGWDVTHATLRVEPEGKLFAPGNLRATADNPKYKALVDHWISERYTLRYTGGLVPDLYQILIKGKGIVTNVVSGKAKAKLRLLYEAAPLALIMECAGGASCTAPGPQGEHATAMSLLDVPMSALEFKCGVAYGSTGEIDIFKKFLYD